MEGSGNLFFYHSFVDCFLGAIRFEFGAVIVSIFLAGFFHFLLGGYGSPTFSANEKPLEGKGCCLVFGKHFFLFKPIEIGLDFVPEFLWNEWRVRSGIELVVLLKIPVVERIAKKSVHGAFGECPSPKVFFELFGRKKTLCL